ncbi:hypothetical protein BCR39DRAFT_465497 [Naematelia encephala]|uniref:DNA polymerase lambda n=1 Tax=Naematelia encephala TaxID=71784 RepID=A0A1Y2BAG1_9TREE|nr:hypothetical protein BCR39DRAFT_465497 [Naematelia encephala]
MPKDTLFPTHRVDFWSELDELDRSGDLEESDEEAEAFDRSIQQEVEAKRVKRHERPERPIDEEEAGLLPIVDEDQLGLTASSHQALPSFHASQILFHSTPKQLRDLSTLPSVDTPLDDTPGATESHQPAGVLDTPENIASPIDTPSSSSRRLTGTGEGRGRRDDPATPVPLGTEAFKNLKGKKDFQTLTKHFELFSKGISKDVTANNANVKGKGKAKAQKSDSMLIAGLGGRVLEGLRFCVPPELGQVGKHKQRWDIISKLGGQVVLQPDTSITHIIYDGRSQIALARELGLKSLSELPEGTVCVRWDWVVQCKLAGRLLDTSQFLSFPKTFTKMISAKAVPATRRLADITSLLSRGTSDSDTESPVKRPRIPSSAIPAIPRPDVFATTRTKKPFLNPWRSELKIVPTVDTVHALPKGPGWKFGKGDDRDDLDDILSALKDGTIYEEECFTSARGMPYCCYHHVVIAHYIRSQSANPDSRGDRFKCGQDHDGTERSTNAGPNEWLAKKFEDLHDMYLGVQGKNQFAIRQYQQGELFFPSCCTPWIITSGKDARRIKGVGQSIADRIDEFISGEPGRAYYEDTEKARIVAVLKDVYGVGETFANELYKRGARSIRDLKEKDFGLTPGQNIGVELYEDLNTRIPREECRAIYELIASKARAIDPKIWVEIMGSYRRGQEDSGDVDILITRDTDDGLTHEGLLKSLVIGLKENGVITHDLSVPSQWDALEAKWMGVGKVPGGRYRRIDILCIPFDQWGAALIYFTGNISDILCLKQFNRSLRLYARKKGYSLNQRGLYVGVIRDKGGLKMTEGEFAVITKTEQEIFDVLGLRWRHPHLRRP